jgi:hypothetical protein
MMRAVSPMLVLRTLTASDAEAFLRAYQAIWVTDPTFARSGAIGERNPAAHSAAGSGSGVRGMAGGTLEITLLRPSFLAR